MIRMNVKTVATVTFVKGWSHVDLVYEKALGLFW